MKTTHSREEMIRDLLQQLAITRNYTAYAPIKTALLMVMENEDWLQRITGLYTEIAKLYDTTPGALQRNFRTLTEVCWRKERAALCRLARRELTGKPNPSEFIDMLSAYLLRREADWESDALS